MESLKKLGLTEYEQAVYTALLAKKTATAEELSTLSKVPITAVYPTTKSLIEKQLIQKTNGKRALFTALPPELGIAKLVSLQKKQLEEDEKKALTHLKSIKAQKNTKEKEIVLVTEGKEISSKLYRKAAEKARKTYYILGWRFNKVGDKYTLLHYFKKLLQRGVDTRIILTGSEKKNDQLIEDYKHEGIQIRYLPIDNFSLFIVDGTECKITLKDKSRSLRNNISILDPSFSQAMHSYFLDCWSKASESQGMR